MPPVGDEKNALSTWLRAEKTSVVPPEFGPKGNGRRSALEPGNGGDPAGHCLPAAYGRRSPRPRQSLAPTGSSLRRGGRVLFPITAFSTVVFYHRCLPASRHAVPGFCCLWPGGFGPFAKWPGEDAPKRAEKQGPRKPLADPAFPKVKK